MDKGHLLAFLGLPLHLHGRMSADDPGGSRRSVEVDFFSDDNKQTCVVERDEPRAASSGLAINKEDLTINLLPAATHDEETKPKEEVELQAELGRMNEENQRLRGMLAQVTTSYQALQMHLLTLMQQAQHQQAPAPLAAVAPIAPPPRQLQLDQQPASNSSTEVGSPRRSSSTANNKEDSPEATGGPAEGRPQQLDQASMRKARVSVRARSEAPIIADGCQWRKVRPEDGQGQPLPASLLPMHHGQRMPRAQAGAALRRRPLHPHHHLRGHAQPPAAARRHGHGLHHLRRRIHAALGLHAQRRQQLPRARRAALLLQHGHHLRVRALPHCHARPHPRPANRRRRRATASAASAAAATAGAAALQPVQVLRPAHVLVAGCWYNNAPADRDRAGRHRQRRGGRHHGGSQLHGGAGGGHHVHHRRRRPAAARQQQQQQQCHEQQ
ncbi:hypothetical protein SETIT_5G001000v2 [Setaria italica]|uniref:WRKY domain-containing protein n=1 Tax=Setaria italica TaxID=4555 RepID=K3XHW3_SETIT|nr:hypothetical protein SETIT_5G001000v2 [Setaria italica]